MHDELFTRSWWTEPTSTDQPWLSHIGLLFDIFFLQTTFLRLSRQKKLRSTLFSAALNNMAALIRMPGDAGTKLPPCGGGEKTIIRVRLGVCGDYKVVVKTLTDTQNYRLIIQNRRSPPSAIQHVKNLCNTTSKWDHKRGTPGNHCLCYSSSS